MSVSYRKRKKHAKFSQRLEATKNTRTISPRLEEKQARNDRMAQTRMAAHNKRVERAQTQVGAFPVMSNCLRKFLTAG